MLGPHPTITKCLGELAVVHSQPDHNPTQSQSGEQEYLPARGGRAVKTRVKKHTQIEGNDLMQQCMGSPPLATLTAVKYLNPN